MAKRRADVNASYGDWRFTIKDGEVVEFRGSFSRSNRDKALGTARHLHNAWITNTEGEPRPIEEYSDGYVVRLRRDRGDRMEKF